MFYEHGQAQALQTLGLTKEAGALDWILRRVTRGRGVKPLAEGEGKRSILKALIGEPERILHPVQLVKEVGSLKPTREHWRTMLHGPSAWEKTKGFGRLAGDIGAKGFLFGFPAYGVYKGITEQPLPGETRGQAVGRAIGEGLGWFPPMGILGTAASLITPEYSLPGATGWLGGQLGKGVSKLIGEEPSRGRPVPYREQARVAVPQSSRLLRAGMGPGGIAG
jgi:hypothetical protein